MSLYDCSQMLSYFRRIGITVQIAQCSPFCVSSNANMSILARLCWTRWSRKGTFRTQMHCRPSARTPIKTMQTATMLRRQQQRLHTQGEAQTAEHQKNCAQVQYGARPLQQRLLSPMGGHTLQKIVYFLCNAHKHKLCCMWINCINTNKVRQQNAHSISGLARATDNGPKANR